MLTTKRMTYGGVALMVIGGGGGGIFLDVNLIAGCRNTARNQYYFFFFFLSETLGKKI